MKKNDKVKAMVNGKYLPGIIKDVEDAKGFKKYPYQKVWVEFLDESVKEFRDYDVIVIHDEEKKKIDKVK